MPERLLWVCVTLVGFVGAAVILHSSITGWIDSPAEVRIETFSLPATSLPYPAITVCKRNKFDATELVRVVFDNFLMSCGPFVFDGVDRRPCAETG